MIIWKRALEYVQFIKWFKSQQSFANCSICSSHPPTNIQCDFCLTFGMDHALLLFVTAIGKIEWVWNIRISVQLTCHEFIQLQNRRQDQEKIQKQECHVKENFLQLAQSSKNVYDKFTKKETNYKNGVSYKSKILQLKSQEGFTKTPPLFWNTFTAKILHGKQVMTRSVSVSVNVETINSWCNILWQTSRPWKWYWRKKTEENCKTTELVNSSLPSLNSVSKDKNPLGQEREEIWKNKNVKITLKAEMGKWIGK